MHRSPGRGDSRFGFYIIRSISSFGRCCHPCRGFNSSCLVPGAAPAAQAYPRLLFLRPVGANIPLAYARRLPDNFSFILCKLVESFAERYTREPAVTASLAKAVAGCHHRFTGFPFNILRGAGGTQLPPLHPCLSAAAPSGAQSPQHSPLAREIALTDVEFAACRMW